MKAIVIDSLLPMVGGSGVVDIPEEQAKRIEAAMASARADIHERLKSPSQEQLATQMKEIFERTNDVNSLLLTHGHLAESYVPMGRGKTSRIYPSINLEAL